MSSSGRPARLAEEDVVGAIGVERRVQVYEVDGLIRDVVPEDVQVIAVVEDVGVHRGQILPRGRGRMAYEWLMRLAPVARLQ